MTSLTRPSSGIKIYDISTWPTDVLLFLRSNEVLLEQLNRRDLGFGDEAVRKIHHGDALMHDFRTLLNNYYLHGYHCTRLTDVEVKNIVKNGLDVLTEDLVVKRINRLEKDRIILPETASRLLANHQASKQNRKDKIYFCFFLPHLAGSGIYRPLKYWGGEALFCCHEADQILGPLLSSIGTPCIIEANVRIETLPYYSYLTNHVVRAYLNSQGIKVDSFEHENCSTSTIPAKDIIRIYKFPEETFIHLTGCDQWHLPL